MNYTTTRKWAAGVLSAIMLSGTLVQAQTANKLARTVQQEMLMNNVNGYDLFELSAQRDPVLDKEIDHVIYLKLHKDVLRSLRNAGSHLISFSLPLTEAAQPFTLYSYNILDEGFKVYERGSDGLKKEVKMKTGSFYRGIMDEAPNSLAAFTFTDDELSAVFSSPGNGNYNLVLNYNDPGPDRDHYILFREKDMKHPQPAGCAMTDAMDKAGGEPGTAAKGTFASCHKVRVSMNGDYKLFLLRGSNVTSSANYLANLFNVISALYANEGIMAVMSETVINSAPDNYTYGNSSEVLYRFSEVIRTSFQGDMAQLISGYKQSGFPPLGGLAWLDRLCDVPVRQGNVWTGPFSICDNYIIDNIPQLPVYSWDVQAATHEMGHNIGSPHTQSCRWPGGPIDNCVAVEDGDCEPGPAPDPAGGTIMSYCHLTPVGINLAFGFGPLPGDLLRKNVMNRPCLSSYMPAQTLVTAEKVRIANRQCSDGQWTSYYYDNNTASEEDDELLLMIDTKGQNIGNVDIAGFEVSMTTTSYGSGSARAVTAPYVSGDWKEANRTWHIKLPAGTAQPAAPVAVRFPFTDQDVLDIKGSLPVLARANQLSVMAFNNGDAAAAPGTAAASAVNYYTNAASTDARHWSLGNTGKYYYAEFESDYGLYGGSIGFKTPAAQTSLEIYPNPATGWLNINVPVGSGSSSTYALTITDQLGRVILQKTYDVASGGNIRLGVTSFARGVYNIRYVGGGATYNARFVKR